MDNNTGKNKKIIKAVCIAAAVCAAAAIAVCAVYIKADKKSDDRNVPAQTEEAASSEKGGQAQSETSPKDEQTQSGAEQNTSDGSAGADAAAQQAEDNKVYTPTFMYFVKKTDADYDAAMKAAAELEAEYDGRVTFDIIDVDEQAERAANFPAEGNTPLLIMLNTKNDISAFEFKCSDKEKLKQAIQNAMK